MVAHNVAGVVQTARSAIAALQSRLRPEPAAAAKTGCPEGVTGPSGAGIDLTTTPSPYRQPDHTTCGSSVLVMARMINHVVLAGDGSTEQLGLYDPSTGLRVQVGRPQILASGLDVAGWDEPWLSILPRPTLWPVNPAVTR